MSDFTIHVFDGSLVRGVSAAGLARVGIRLWLFVVAPSTLAFLVLLWTRPAHSSAPPFYLLFVALSGCAIVMITLLANLFVPRKEKAEVSLGYTTLRGVHIDVPQVIEGTTYIVRAAGEAYIDGVEYVARAQQIEQSTGRILKVPRTARRLYLPSTWLTAAVLIVLLMVFALIAAR